MDGHRRGSRLCTMSFTWWTAKVLKELYSSLMHVTCVAHLLHNCAMRVRAHFKNIDEIIATIKVATIKNKDRKKDFHDAGLPSPPDPVIRRWATWLRVALYYSENLPAVRTIVNNWTSAGVSTSPKINRPRGATRRGRSIRLPLRFCD